MVRFRAVEIMSPRIPSIDRQSLRIRRSVLAILFFLTALSLRAQNVADDQSYNTYLDWEKAQPPSPSWDQNDLLVRYAEHLKADGLDQNAVDHLISGLRRRLDADEAAFWDKIYAQSTEPFNLLPNHLLVQAVKGIKPGKALEVEMGQGRNSLYLAQQGWDVTGFDFSPKALDLAQQHAKQAGVTIHTVLSKDEDFQFGREQWDLIALLYPMEKRSYAKVREALKPGGVVVVEGFHQDVHGPAVRYASNELLNRFAGFNILYYEDAVGLADWGQHDVRLVKLIAQKTAEP
jgi:2-polyprenyl-3-methyl-5-hydroxy-6-metoxy-1,4-benzoquinol methylase